MVLLNNTMSSTITRRDVNAVGILNEDDDVAEQIFLEVSVINPITRKEPDGELVTTYAIYIETNDSAFTMAKSMVRRRYSEFVTLRCILQKQHPSLSVPKLPGRTFLGKRFDQRFIQDRCRALQDFLKGIVYQPLYLSNKTLHLFLQSSIPMKKVKDMANAGESLGLTQNPSPPYILCPVENRKPSGRVGILKQDSCTSLAFASGDERECRIKEKHKHMRVGTGVVVCTYVPGQEPDQASSAPFNIPNKQGSPVYLRSCASDTCLDGVNIGSLSGSKKKVSFLIENESLIKKVVDVQSKKRSSSASRKSSRRIRQADDAAQA